MWCHSNTSCFKRQHLTFFLASRSLQMWINLNKKMFWMLDFSYFAFIVVIITCRILLFQYGGSSLVTACRMQILSWILANQIHWYKHIALESLTCSPLLICYCMGDLRRPHYGSHESDLISWIYNDKINTVVIFFGQSDCS